MPNKTTAGRCRQPEQNRRTIALRLLKHAWGGPFLYTRSTSPSSEDLSPGFRPHLRPAWSKETVPKETRYEAPKLRVGFTHGARVAEGMFDEGRVADPLPVRAEAARRPSASHDRRPGCASRPDTSRASVWRRRRGGPSAWSEGAEGRHPQHEESLHTYNSRFANLQFLGPGNWL
jgi:hypothetical protein